MYVNVLSDMICARSKLNCNTCTLLLPLLTLCASTNEYALGYKMINKVIKLLCNLLPEFISQIHN